MIKLAIRSGDPVIVRSATGDLHRRALTGPVPGQDFTVIWLCTDDEWDDAQKNGREPSGTPWPVEDVRPA